MKFVPDRLRGASPIAPATETSQGAVRFVSYALLGTFIGGVVVVLDWLSIDKLLHWLHDAPLSVQAGAPVLGVAISAVVLKLAWRSDPGTSDKYVEAYHGTEHIQARRVFPKLTAALATVGLGGALGLEGPAVYAGAASGQWLGKLQIGRFSFGSRRALLAAGAAAGVAAVFRAPATGVLFALESPFRRDLARHALVPALIASAAAYITFVLALGPQRLFLIRSVDVSLADEILGAVTIGILGGLTARGVAVLFHWAKDQVVIRPVAIRVPVGGAVLALAVLGANALVGEPITLGPGAELVADLVLDTDISVWIIIGIFGLRAIATSATLAAGGVGGVFIPLVVQGLLLGRVVETIFDQPSNGLFPVVALAAVLGAGYRTPLAAVMFVAETTGRSEFVIPALLATAISNSLMGDISVSSGQVDERKGQLEHRLSRPTREVTLAETARCRPDDSLLDIIDELGETEAPIVPVFDDGYAGLLVLADVAPALMSEGLDATARSIMRDIPAGTADSPARDTVDIMRVHNTAAVAVLDSRNELAGIVTATSLAGLNDLA